MRVLFAQDLYIRTQPVQYWQHDIELGWSRPPLVKGEFSNGYFHGEFHTDENGNRMNSSNSTYMAGYRNIFMIGDSVTASLEVDDNETVAALLEQELRLRGDKVNVVNLGVRGYGTDQAVRKALLFSAAYQPSDIIYTFVINDVADNNRIRKNIFGKGIYYRTDEESAFATHNYPVIPFNDYLRGVVLMDNECRPLIHEEEGKAPIMEPRKPWYYKFSYTLRARKKIKDLINVWIEERKHHTTSGSQSKSNGHNSVNDLRASEKKPITMDPYHLVQNKSLSIDQESFWNLFQDAYGPKGITRIRCQSYFDDQLQYLLSLLRTISSLERIHVVFHGIPGQDENKLNADPNLLTMRRIKRQGLVDTLIVLPSKPVPKGMDSHDFYCPRDTHFCEIGNRWVTEQLLEEAFPIPKQTEWESEQESNQVIPEPIQNY